jgi:peptidoglycan/LPS O-acetylase OafA/YrhL
MVVAICARIRHLVHADTNARKFMTPSIHAARDELPNLDSLRALAVLLVLADHALETVGEHLGHSFHPVDWYFGRLGVLMFFVHTCYVLMASLNRLGGAGWELAQSFFIRRIFRIYPLAIFAIVVMVLLDVPSLPWLSYQPPTAGGLASNLTLTMNLTGSDLVLDPLWTLPLELQMYLVLPVIFLFTNRVTDLRRVLGFWLLSLLGAMFVAPVSERLVVATFGPCFMAGVIAYALRDRVIARAPAALWLPALLALVGLYMTIESFTPGIHHLSLQAAFCLLVGLCIPWFRQSASTGFNRVAHLLARYSYGIYLFHCVALWIGYYGIAPESEVLKALLSLAALVVLAVASFHWLETPMIRLGAKLSRAVSLRGGSVARSPCRDTP